MPGFDFAPGIEETAASSSEVANRLADQLPRMIRVDRDTGAVEVNEGDVRGVVEGLLPPEVGAAFTTNLIELAGGGVAIFGSPDREFSAVPWLALEDITYALQGTPSVLRADLGVAEARDGREASQLLRRQFPGVPDDIFSEGVADLLIHDPRGLPMNGIDPPDDPFPDEPDPATAPKRPRKTTVGSGSPSIQVSGIVPPSPEKAAEVALCFLNGTWTGWWGNGWWETASGWVPGFKVCLDRDCADKLADMLIGFGGVSALISAIGKALAQGVAAALKFVVSAAAIALAVIGLLLGVNIKLVNGPNGACLWFSWPWTGGIVFWATGR